MYERFIGVGKREGEFERAPPGSLLEVALDDLIESVRRAKRRAWLASPYLSTSAARLVASAARYTSADDLRLVTALAGGPVKRGVLSVKGLELLREAGFQLRSVPNLHAKTAVVDGDWGLAGSGNLTAAGLGFTGTGNVELGVVLTRRQVATAGDRFEGWWNAATPILEEDLALYARLAPKLANARAAARERGPVHGEPIPVGRGRELSRLDDERVPRRPGRRYWLKMLYHDERDLDRWWEEMTWVSDVHRRRKSDHEPLLRPSYEVGDLLVLYLVGEGCPAIAEVSGKPDFDPKRVARESNRNDAKRWGWLTEVVVIHRTATGLTGAPDLNDLRIKPSSVRQHGHIEISAKTYARALAAIESNAAERSRTSAAR
jgi:hypothetical protein